MNFVEKLATRMVLHVYKLNSVAEKVYSSYRSSDNDVYVFHNKDEFYHYFLDNNIIIDNNDIFELAILSELRNGDIIALKNSCDYIIDRINKMKDSDEFSFDFMEPKQKIKNNNI